MGLRIVSKIAMLLFAAIAVMMVRKDVSLRRCGGHRLKTQIKSIRRRSWCDIRSPWNIFVVWCLLRQARF